MQKELSLFKDLFQPFENIALLHINNKVDFLSPILQEVATTFNGSCEEKVFTNESSARLRGHARDYEYIILSDILSHCENRDKVIKMMYHALENSANIIILEKISHNNVAEIKELLDKTSFVAINHINLFEEYVIITAKKLHMWGSGL